MRILDRYLVKTVCSAIFVVYLIVFAIDSFIWLAGEVDDIGHAQYGMQDAVYYVLLQMPSQLSALFPLICLLGALIGLGMLGSSNEIIAMRVSRLSITRILVVMAAMALCLGTIVTSLGESVGFYAKQKAEDMKNSRLERQVNDDVTNLWLKLDKQYWHIANMSFDGTLANITGWQFGKDNRLIEAIYAPFGYLCEQAWCLKKVNSTVFTDEKTINQHQRLRKVHTSIDYKLLATMMRGPEEISLRLLWYLTKKSDYILGKVNQKQYALNLWQRVLQPLYALVMILLAVPIIFGPLRSSNMGMRLLVGVVVGFVFYVLQNIAGPIGVFLNYPPWLSASFPALCCLLLSSLIMRRTI